MFHAITWGIVYLVFSRGAPSFENKKEKKSRRPGGGCVKEFSVCLSRVGIPHHLPSFPFYSTLMRRVSVREKKFGGPGYFRRLVGKRGRRKKKKKPVRVGSTVERRDATTTIPISLDGIQ